MNRLEDSDLERLLGLHAAPRPPAGLAASIKDEIPPLLPFALRQHRNGAAHAALVLDRQVSGWAQLASLIAALVTVVAALALFSTLAPPAGREARLAALRGSDGDTRVEVVRSAEPSVTESAALRLVTIEVAVLGPDDEPRQGAAVAVERLGTEKRSVELTTDRRGRALVAGLLPGNYRVRCTPTPGEEASDEVTLAAGQAASLLLLLGHAD